ncbi:MAG: [acyl-carrier-protein] S-malonyltransferase [Deltaproteobacteria bacterium]|nr:ACP S-malonyltransferase [Deltaproteobacteria bacterium]RLA91684.1 MAG: [acyl-carrier-protein] S-malonyltransferase [Deltaproteobacteria bacterium]
MVTNNEIAFIFPGQGSQYVGMGKEFFEEYPIAREIFQEASDVLGFDMAQLCFEGPEEKLRLTENTQPALLTVSIAVLKTFLSIKDIQPSLVAGHSLGEYSALVAVDSIDFGNAVKIVRLRGRFMEEAVPEGLGAMAAVIGLDEKKVIELCKKAANGAVLSPANFNSPGQVVISGEAEAVKRAIKIGSELGAKKVIPLKVSGPFHSSLMAPAAKRLERELKSISFKDPIVPVVTNVEAKPNKDGSRVVSLLVDQLTSPVKWEQSIRNMIDMGIKIFIEFGPGKVLTGLIKRINKDITLFNVERPDDIKKVVEFLDAK